MNSLVEAFGTTKQKRALVSRRLNQVGSEALQQVVAKAANSVIEQKGFAGKRACVLIMSIRFDLLG